MDKLKELEKLLLSECGKYENNCNYCPFKKECNEYEKIYNNK